MIVTVSSYFEKVLRYFLSDELVILNGHSFQVGYYFFAIKA